MNSKIKDGILIDNKIQIVDNKRNEFPLYIRIYQFLAVLIGGWSMIFILIESFVIPVNTVPVFIALIGFSMVFFLLFLFSKYDLVKMFFVCVFYCLFAMSLFPRLQNGFYILENLVCNQINSYYGLHIVHYKADYSMGSEDTTLLIIMLLYLVIVLLTIAVLRNRYISICSIILLFPVAASFILGIIPSEQYLVAYVIIMLFLSRASGLGHHITDKSQKTLYQRVNSRAAVWLSLLGLLLFFVIKLFVTPQGYEDITEIKEVKADIQDFLYEFSFEDFADKWNNFGLFASKEGNGGLSGGELGRVDKVVYDNSEQLRITAPIVSIKKGLYLKGYVGSEYTGNSWEGLGKEEIKQYEKLMSVLVQEVFSPINQGNMFLDKLIHISNRKEELYTTSYIMKIPNYQIYNGNIKVEYKDANKNYIYAPYDTKFSSSDHVRYQQDLFAAPISKQEYYEFDYYFYHTLSDNVSKLYNLSEQMGDYVKYEKIYRNYVYQVYTKLPLKGLERLKQEFSDIEKLTEQNNILEQIDYVKQYLESKTQYSLSPGKLPRGKDFVEYFLYENNVGYCSHYASAATLMLRAMGIPARYVEGYVVAASDMMDNGATLGQDVTIYTNEHISETYMSQAIVSVKDYNAHAWVEVYIDGCGWIPIEFTPGSGIEETGVTMEEMMVLGENITQKEEPQVTPTDTPIEPSAEPKSEDQPTIGPEQEVVDGDTKVKKSQEQLNQIKSLFSLLSTVIIMGIVIFIIGKAIYKKVKFKNEKNLNKKALYLYAEVEKIVSVSRWLPKRGAQLEDHLDYVKEHCPCFETGTYSGFLDGVQKARFGRNIISRYELKEIEGFHQNLYKEAYQNATFGRRVYLKLVIMLNIV